MPLLATLPADYAATMEYFQTTRVDARSNQPFPVAPSPPPREIAIAGDGSITPTVRFHVGDRRWDYTLTYSPSFSITDFELLHDAQPVVLNAGAISVGWHDRRTRIVVSESASYGWENLAFLYGTPLAGQATAAGQSQGTTQGGQQTGQAGQGQGAQAGQPGTPTPGGTPSGGTPTTGPVPGQTGTAPTVPIQTFPFGSSRSEMTITHDLSHETTVSVNGGYSISGNLAGSAEVSAVYPEQFGPFGRVSVAHATSETDAFTTVASGSEVTTPNGVCVGATTPGLTCRQSTPTLVLQETWRHALSEREAMTVSAGASATIYPLTSGEAWGILPIGGVSYTRRFQARAQAARRNALEASSLRLSAELAPMINVFTGVPSNRVQLTAVYVHPVATNVTLSWLAGSLQTISFPYDDPSPLTVFNGGLETRVRLTDSILLSLGLQGFWQSQQNVGALPNGAAQTGATTSGSEVGYASVTIRPPAIRF